MILGSRALESVRSTVSGLLTIALISFAYACAAHVGSCDGSTNRACPVAASAPAGCAHHSRSADPPAHGCEQVAACCSTWAPAPITPGVPDPPMAVSVFPRPSDLLAPTSVLGSALVPIPAESPPPIVSVLRL